ncbi:MAG: adenine phosphoribosyltransferase [Polyangiales bacterium]
MSERLERARAMIRDVPDFPKPGILFKDITPLLGDAESFAAVLDALVDRYRAEGIHKVLGIEARGFIFGAALASRLGVGFVPARKPAKLPWQTDRIVYALEYGTDSIEIHKGSFEAGERALVVDDVIATGGTAAAAVELVRRQGATVAGVAFLVELSFLNGRKRLPDDVDVFSLMRF